MGGRLRRTPAARGRSDVATLAEWAGGKAVHGDAELARRGRPHHHRHHVTDVFRSFNTPDPLNPAACARAILGKRRVASTTSGLRSCSPSSPADLLGNALGSPTRLPLHRRARRCPRFQGRAAVRRRHLYRRLGKGYETAIISRAGRAIVTA
jgi:hypothetical protein